MSVEFSKIIESLEVLRSERVSCKDSESAISELSQKYGIVFWGSKLNCISVPEFNLVFNKMFSTDIPLEASNSLVLKACDSLGLRCEEIGVSLRNGEKDYLIYLFV